MLRAIWFIIKGLAILYALFVGLLLFIAASLGLTALPQELPRQWADLWRGKAEAQVVEVRSRCQIREPREPKSRTPAVFIDVPCERLAEERAARPAGTWSSGPIVEVTIRFRAASGKDVIASTSAHALGLGETVAVGHRLAVSYDPAKPERDATKASDFATFVMVAVGCLAVVTAGLGAVAYLAWIQASARARRRRPWHTKALRREEAFTP